MKESKGYDFNVMYFFQVNCPYCGEPNDESNYLAEDNGMDTCWNCKKKFEFSYNVYDEL